MSYKHYNKSLSQSVFNFLKETNQYFEDQIEAMRFNQYIEKFNDNDQNYEKFSILSEEELLSFLSHYKKSNTKVAIEYLNRKNGILFSDHLREDSSKTNKPKNNSKFNFEFASKIAVAIWKDFNK